MTFLWLSAYHKSSKRSKECTKGDLKNETIHSVAIKLPFYFILKDGV